MCWPTGQSRARHSSSASVSMAAKRPRSGSAPHDPATPRPVRARPRVLVSPAVRLSTTASSSSGRAVSWSPRWNASQPAAGTFLAMPIGGGLAYWAAGHYTASSFRDPVPGRAARVRSRFEDVIGVHADVLDQVTDDARVQFSPADQVWVDMPVGGRVVLAGDAWHAATPSMAQGGSMAVEDAVVLAQELAAGRDIDEALARYASRR